MGKRQLRAELAELQEQTRRNAELGIRLNRYLEERCAGGKRPGQSVVDRTIEVLEERESELVSYRAEGETRRQRHSDAARKAAETRRAKAAAKAAPPKRQKPRAATRPTSSARGGRTTKR